MIYYKSNQSWLNDIRHLFTSYTMKKVVIASLWMGLFTTIIFVLNHFFPFSMPLKLGTSIFSVLGIVLSILLVFRTNTAYDRWWEGRKQWGALVNHTRNLAIATKVTFPEDEKQPLKRMAQLITNFCIALKEHLRDGTKIDELIELTGEERSDYASKKHLPNYISTQIHFLVEHMHRNGKITPEDHLNFKPHTQALLDILGACERIKKTPIPFSYNVYLKIFISAYGLVLPFSVIPEFGIFAIPISMLVFFAFMGMELMAEEIEDPFGLDCNDLPTGDIAHTIRQNVYEILTESPQQFTLKEKEAYTKVF